jgi:hypothetical protein
MRESFGAPWTRVGWLNVGDGKRGEREGGLISAKEGGWCWMGFGIVS